MRLKRVLIADADESVHGPYEAYLSRHGFRVATAKSGLDCVAQLRSFLPHALVLDPDLPWGWGEGVLAMMYEDPEVPIVPVMVLSRQRNGEALRRLGVFPVGAYEVKPVEPERLLEGIRGLLGRYVTKRKRRRRRVAG